MSWYNTYSAYSNLSLYFFNRLGSKMSSQHAQPMLESWDLTKLVKDNWRTQYAGPEWNSSVQDIRFIHLSSPKNPKTIIPTLGELRNASPKEWKSQVWKQKIVSKKWTKLKNERLGRLQYKHVEPIAGFQKSVKKIVYPPLKQCEKMFYPPSTR